MQGISSGLNMVTHAAERDESVKREYAGASRPRSSCSRNRSSLLETVHWAATEQHQWWPSSRLSVGRFSVLDGDGKGGSAGGGGGAKKDEEDYNLAMLDDVVGWLRTSGCTSTRRI